MFDPEMLQLWLFLHILGAIAAFGYGFYAPVFGMASAKEPEHSNWFSRASKRVSNIIIIPFAIFMFLTGAALVETSPAWEWSTRWLSAEAPGPEGPPAEMHVHVRRMQIYGVILLLLTLVILALMVWKPALGQ